MAALVQTLPQQTGTIPVLPTRPSSSSGTFASQSTAPSSRAHTMSWSGFNAANSGGYQAGYPVVAPYGYAAPNLGHSSNAQHRQSWSPHMRPENRTFSAPTIPPGSMNPAYAGAHPRVAPHPAAGSVSTSSSSNSSFRSHFSKDDSALPSRQLRGDQQLRPLSTANIPSPVSVMNISSPSGAVKPSPNRYRRGNQRAEAASPSQSSATGSPLQASTVVTPEDQAAAVSSTPNVLRLNGHSRVSSVDDSSYVDRSQPELAKRYRRRSLGNIDSSAYPNLQLQLPTTTPPSGSYDFISFDSNRRPQSAHSQRESLGSIHSAHSSTSSVREGAAADSSSANIKSGKSEEIKRKPSPLSQPVSTSSQSPQPAKTATDPEQKSSPSPLDSPAAKRLTELKNEGKRPGKSRLRRAFSFGSASELLKASAQTNANKREAVAAERARREALQDELGPEQAAIAEQQEAGGLGESIYSHQSHFFAGSTDNLSISSTASSASMMLRKMGKGMKKSTRSLVGLFRAKSIASINSTEGATMEPSMPQISVVNVEAERESVAVNADPQDMHHGGTVFPKVESSGSDNGRSSFVQERIAMENSQSRKSIMGGDRERAEVLAAVRKGILKKTHSDLDVTTAAHALNGTTDSPHSSAPTTPDESTRSVHRHTDSVKIAGEDYFLSSEGRYTASEAKSAPITPQAVAGRNIVFSPRIQFHETWPSGEYDRRGEIATCNRLTPLLAQQIREEINNFKMEMEVHENSKIYTHFI
ncbi:hypothetical protein N7474_004653 [Penicillium riverlandense]|uniref:uncharacterized protein n=1 Tax=Penicillium riverlandense TaxID=1903569 RepID=UPI0025481AC4|nr:uncharacterized protein N7474_004653 [Penicillium riverlandense]KAJ5819062.1 hypothetical protein N7474_004653 [Penicillium riverlandense]